MQDFGGDIESNDGEFGGDAEDDNNEEGFAGESEDGDELPSLGDWDCDEDCGSNDDESDLSDDFGLFSNSLSFGIDFRGRFLRIISSSGFASSY